MGVGIGVMQLRILVEPTSNMVAVDVTNLKICKSKGWGVRSREGGKYLAVLV